MTSADAIKAVREALASFQSVGLGSSFDVEQIRRERFAFMRTALEHLPAILDAAEQSEQRRARAEAFERIRRLDGMFRNFAVDSIIDDVDAAERGGS